MANLYRAALDELAGVFDRIDEAAVDRALDAIAQARRIAFYGCGREGLQLRGLCMRLFHMGLKVAMVGDMTTPALGAGDLLIVSAGPGELATASALADVAKAAGARVMVITAQVQGATARRGDVVLPIPAQTMADDRGPSVSVLPMGSLFEGAMFVLFEAMVLRLRDRLGVTPETMRANHTNLE